MIKHVVAFRMDKKLSADEKTDAMNKMKSLLEALPPKIDELEAAEVGINFNPTDAAFDVVLTTTHLSQEALGTYAGHPEHLEVLAYIRSVISERIVVDYER
ncbi:Dabb family protein [Desulfoluna spongiiphila]|uniref:Dabb family protein n=1 Tax=Desulfoluna spongiiphila TaxID=419481 RepID=UPI00125BFF11|nr:Dabb family protein [Desulfoluna spongiiphila]VVS92872.1 dimeric alpha-beta barrel [Desulfoluna spongiiphila]